MKLSRKEIEKVASLAKLRIEEDEIPEMEHSLNEAINFFDKLNELNTENIEPLVYVTNEKNVLRKDLPQNSNLKNVALENAPSANSDYFKVQKE